MIDFDYRGVNWEAHPGMHLEKCIRLLEADAGHSVDDLVCPGICYGELLSTLMIIRRRVGIDTEGMVYDPDDGE